MFWNALLRKGWRWKKEEFSAKQVEDSVKIHNANNEATWLKILEWEEALHAKECGSPKYF